MRAGRGKLIIGNQVTTFEAGDLIAIGSNLPHVFLSDGKVKSSHM
ncbi:MAG: AraC family transcriptional regulator, partial [Croceivirga sp.]